MLNSRKLDDLHASVQEAAHVFLTYARREGIDLIVTSTFRDFEAQAALYAQGRTAPGKIVTNAKPGQSWHNWRVAFDVVPLRHGKPVWGTSGQDLTLWRMVGFLGKQCRLEWAGDWNTFREFPHFQFTNNLTIEDLKAGRKP